MKYETIVCPFCGNGHAHIIYEENRVYQMNCPDCHNAIFHRDTSWDNAVSFFKRMVVTDESAIRQQETVSNRNEPMTNARKIRSMSDEELANIIECPYGNPYFDEHLPCKGSCHDCLLIWLKQPAEEDDHES